MSHRLRLLVLLVSTPIIAFAIIGGFLGKAIARDETYQHLKVFEDVVSLIVSNYVDEVHLDHVMIGAMHGLADGLDPDSSFLTAVEVKALESKTPEQPGEVGLELTRQYYLRVIAARDGSPAARAGFQPGDYIRAIDGKPTRDISVFQGTRALRGPVGSKVSLTVIRGNAAEPHVIELVRERRVTPTLGTRMLQESVGYLRIPVFMDRTDVQLRLEASALLKQGARSLLLDLRGTAEGPLEEGIEAARVFLDSGTVAIREGRDIERQVIPAEFGQETIALPMALLIDHGTSGAAEVLAAALSGNKRAETFGERTLGRTAVQKLVKLPDGSGLWLTYLRYLTPDGTPIHDKGLQPTVEVEQPDIEFGEPPSGGDPTLDRAIEALRKKVDQ